MNAHIPNHGTDCPGCLIEELLEALEACMEVAFTGPSAPVWARDHAMWKRSIEALAVAAIARAKS